MGLLLLSPRLDLIRRAFSSCHRTFALAPDIPTSLLAKTNPKPPPVEKRLPFEAQREPIPASSDNPGFLGLSTGGGVAASQQSLRPSPASAASSLPRESSLSAS